MARIGLIVAILLAAGSSYADECCVGRVGDANGEGIYPDEVTLGDIMLLVDAKFISGDCSKLPCLGEADVNQDGGADPNCDDHVTLGDIMTLVDFLFITGPEHATLPVCLSGTAIDIDGNVYQTVTIGTQVWMAENLKVTHYRNGDAIPNVIDNDTWKGFTTGAYCEYNNDVSNVTTYGRLYNWHAVNDSRNIAPAGWHVPTDDEWKQLEMYLGMSQADADGIDWRGTDEGNKLREAGTEHWSSPNEGATNESGFTALPGGHRRPHEPGDYMYVRDLASFWSSTEHQSYYAFGRYLQYNISGINRYDYQDKQFGYSIRCVKDPEENTVTDIDGNVYQTVTIGSQVWMAENLKVTRYRNGDAIPNVTDHNTWMGLTTGAYCEYLNDVTNVATYGRLYNWYALTDSRNIAPVGWHVPTDEEWKQLEMTLGMSQAQADGAGWRGTTEGGKLKEADTTHWLSPNTGATNESGFTALPGGSRNISGAYYDICDYAVFWSSTESNSGSGWNRDLRYVSSAVHRGSNYKHYGFSVRCVED